MLVALLQEFTVVPFSERIILLVKIGEDFTIAIRRKDSHLKTGFVPTMTERFQFVN